MNKHHKQHSVTLYTILILLVALVVLISLQAFPVASETVLNMVSSVIGGA